VILEKASTVPDLKLMVQAHWGPDNSLIQMLLALCFTGSKGAYILLRVIWLEKNPKIMSSDRQKVQYKGSVSILVASRDGASIHRGHCGQGTLLSSSIDTPQKL
jgi:hypothetical protein